MKTKAYKGLCEIICVAKTGCPDNLKDVEPACVYCPSAMVEVKDLENKTICVLAETKRPEKKKPKAAPDKPSDAESKFKAINL